MCMSMAEGYELVAGDDKSKTRAREIGSPRTSEISVRFFARLRFYVLNGRHGT